MNIQSARLLAWILGFASLWVHGAAFLPLHAAVVFHVGPGAINPSENLLFNGNGLIATGVTVEGITNQTNRVFEIMSNDNPLETLTTPAQGQARVTSMDGALASVMLAPKLVGVLFDQLEFNVNVINRLSGAFSLTVVDQFNNVHVDTFNPNTIAQGQNFFSVEGTNGTKFKKATLTASGQILEDIRQIRVGGVVPEPGSFAAMGFLSLLALLPMRTRR